jgi:hypothetical protein
MTRRILRAALVAFIVVILITTNRFVTLAAETELPTPLLVSVPDPPAPFTGSDQRIHLVYELWITNFSSGDATLQTVEVLGDGAVLRKLDAAEIARRLQPSANLFPSCPKARRRCCSSTSILRPTPACLVRSLIASPRTSRLRLPATGN